MSGLDLRPLKAALVGPLLVWAVIVIGVSAAGYPGVACLTPVAWLLAAPVGRDCVGRAARPLTKLPWREAGVAGLGLGLGEGLLMAGALGLQSYLTAPAELAQTLTLCAVIGLVGALVCAGIAIAVCALAYNTASAEWTRDT